MTLDDLPVNGKIYFAGIGGISMSALAMILYNKGYDVCGYDRTATALTSEMEKKGIRIFYETKESNLDGVRCAIYSAALKSDNPEIIQIQRKGIPLYKRAELLGALAREYANSIGVAGTHGKSTTSGMLSYIFMHGQKYDPTVIVGAVLPNLNSTFRLGSDENFIFEADEYTDSFLNFFPHIAVVLNIKMDHTDYFPNYERYIQSFNKFINNTGKDGYAIVNKECEGCTRAAVEYPGTVITYSATGDETADFYAKNIVLKKGFASFDVYKRGEYYMSARLSVPGAHNVANALAAIACCDLCGVDKETIAGGLLDFKGVRRRFEYKGTFNGADVYDDYAHHPDEIRATLATAKNMEYDRVVCVFQPHTYSRLNDLFEDFASSFHDSDLAVFADVYSARENNIYGISSANLSERVGGSKYFDSFEKIKEYLKKEIRAGDLLIFMGAGNITELAEEVVRPQ